MGVGGSTAVSVVYVDELQKRLEENLQRKYERGMRRVLPSLTSSLGIFVALQQIAVGMGKVMSATIADCESMSGGKFGFGSWRTQALNCGAAPTARSRAALRIRVTDREVVWACHAPFLGDAQQGDKCVRHARRASDSERLTRALRSGGCVRACGARDLTRCERGEHRGVPQRGGQHRGHCGAARTRLSGLHGLPFAPRHRQRHARRGRDPVEQPQNHLGRGQGDKMDWYKFSKKCSCSALLH
jgi:hypothetical protein